MNNEVFLPPSQRFGVDSGESISDDFPERARFALLSVIAELVRQKHVDGWKPLLREAERVGRALPIYRRTRVSEDQKRLEEFVRKLQWYEVLYFCELIHDKHLQPVSQVDWSSRGNREVMSLADVRARFESEINRILVEESIALDFREGKFTRPGQPHTQAVVVRASRTMAIPQLADARRHYEKALSFFSRMPDPDYENAVKEAVQALESAVKHLTPGSRKKDFDKILVSVQGTGAGHIPPAIASSLRNIYGFRGAATGVAHGGATGGVVDEAAAEYVISAVGAAVIYFASRGQQSASKSTF